MLFLERWVGGQRRNWILGTKERFVTIDGPRFVVVVVLFFFSSSSSFSSFSFFFSFSLFLDARYVCIFLSFSFSHSPTFDSLKVRRWRRGEGGLCSRVRGIDWAMDGLWLGQILTLRCFWEGVMFVLCVCLKEW